MRGWTAAYIIRSVVLAPQARCSSERRVQVHHLRESAALSGGVAPIFDRAARDPRAAVDRNQYRLLHLKFLLASLEIAWRMD